MRVAVLGWLVLDFASSRGVLKCVQGFLHVALRGRYACDHVCVGVTSQRVLENPRQLAFAVGNVNLGVLPILPLAKRVDDITQHQEGLIDIDPLVHGLADCLRLL